MPSLLAIAPVPALLAALLARGAALALPQVMLGLQFALDTPGALLLGVAALLWTAGGFYASTWLRGIPDAGRFAVWWLLTLTGSIGVFIATDLVSFYLVFSMVSLAAYGLIIDDGTPSARRNGLIYVALALLGEAFLLMAFVMLAQAVPNHSLLIRDAVAALPVSPWRTATLTLLLLGFGAKIGIVPFHVWMPLAYRSAPIPAAAVLSGAAVKAGVIGFIQFLPLHAALPAWGEALTAAGFLSAFYGVAIGITQSNPKTVLAYSSVSQMGVIAAVLGMGLAAGRQRRRVVNELLRGAPHARERRALSGRWCRADLRAASRVDGVGAGGDFGARSRWFAADRWHAREACREGATRRWRCGPACDGVVRRISVADAALSRPARSDRGARASAVDVAAVNAVARDGTCLGRWFPGCCS